MFVVAFHFIYLKLFSLNTRYTTMSRVYTTANIVGRMIENPFQHLYTVCFFLKLSKAGFFFFGAGGKRKSSPSSRLRQAKAFIQQFPVRISHPPTAAILSLVRRPPRDLAHFSSLPSPPSPAIVGIFSLRCCCCCCVFFPS